MNIDFQSLKMCLLFNRIFNPHLATKCHYYDISFYHYDQTFPHSMDKNKPKPAPKKQKMPKFITPMGYYGSDDINK